MWCPKPHFKSFNVTESLNSMFSNRMITHPVNVTQLRRSSPSLEDPLLGGHVVGTCAPLMSHQAVDDDVSTIGSSSESYSSS
jgi:hypothetical protein